MPCHAGTREDPYDLILSEAAEPEMTRAGYREGDLLRMSFGWWRITYSRYIPLTSPPEN
jgi:hypothetical protein